MKSSDERIDEELRKALKDRFDHFERLPDPSLRDKVFKGLADSRIMLQTGIVSALLLLIAVTAVVYVGSRRGASKAYRLAAGSHVASAAHGAGAAHGASAAHGAGKEALDREAVGANRPGVIPVTEAPAKVVEGKIPVSAAVQQAAHLNAFKPAKNTVAPVKIQHRAAAPPRKLVSQKPRSGALEPYHATALINRDEVKQPKAASQTAHTAPGTIPPRAQATLSQQDSSAGRAAQTNLEGHSVAGQDIGVLDHTPLALPQYHWAADTLVTPGQPKKRYALLFKPRWAILAGLTPLRTFQILTVRPGNGVVYQNFDLPSKISAETIGYKFHAGVERGGFQLLLNYGQFRQSYRYEIATGEFVVGPGLSGNYEVVRKGIPKEQNSTARLVGLSVKKHAVRRSHFLRNYYGDVGAEFSRELTSKSNMLWINAGFGKELFAGKDVALTVGPYVEYSVFKLRNPENPFKIRPYQIGLAVGMRYTRR